MARNLDSSLAAALSGSLIYPAVLAMITFRSEVTFIWSGTSTLSYNGHDYLGVGTLGAVGPISEGSDISAAGTTVALSGIAPASLLSEALGDIQVGATASIWFALLSDGAVIGAPYLIFSGTVDKPTVHVSRSDISIQLALENRLINLQRASQKRYTAAEQAIAYPDDRAFDWVEELNDIALRWGS